jgi:superfamily II DNA or RNA helicase
MKKFQLRRYQEECVQKGLEYINAKKDKGPGIIIAPTGCHAAGYKILMYDGTQKNVEDITLQDIVMGNDSTPRKVLQLFSGKEQMYRIVLKNGTEFTVNENHILHLKRTGKNSSRPGRYNAYPEVLNISVKDYLKLLPSWKHLYKITRSSVIFEGEKDFKDLPIDPYFLGIWLADGSKDSTTITTMDEEIKDYLKSFAKEQDLVYKESYKKGTEAITAKLIGKTTTSNHLLYKMRDSNLFSNKHIPREYLTATREVRLQLLAGILDGDGYKGKNGGFDIIQKSEQLSKDIYFLANSLGYFTRYRIAMKSCTNCKDTSKKPYFKLSFRADMDIPFKIDRRKPIGMHPNKDNSMYGFDVEDVGIGDFYGFNLDSNNLYIDEHFIVQHNSGKSLIISELATRAKRPILCLQPSKELLEQNYSKLISSGGKATMYSASVGKKEASELTFATLGSIKDVAHKFKDLGVEILLVDEVHFGNPPTPGSQFMKFIEELQPKKVIGLTATPVFLKNSMEGAELKFITRMRPSYFKQVIHCVQIQELVRDKFWSPLRYEIQPFDNSSLKFNSNGSDFTEDSVKLAAKNNDVNNRMYARIKQLLAKGYKKILVFMDCIENAEIMANALKKTTTSGFIHSKMGKKEREKTLKAFSDGSIKVVTNVSILSTGYDNPEIDAILVGSATNSLARYYQILGRGVRIHPNKSHCFVSDFMGNVERFGFIEHLEIIDNPDHGYGIYNGDVLLTNTPMNGRKITKKMLAKKAKKISDDFDDIMPFGKHKGQKISELPINYLKMITSPTCTINWNHNPISRRIKQEILRMISESESFNFVKK